MKKIIHYVSRISDLIRKYLKKIRQYGVRNSIVILKNKILHKSVDCEDRYEKWFYQHIPSAYELDEQRKTAFAYTPLISIIVPLYKTPELYLREMINSVREQSYSNWELCLSDGSGADSPIQVFLEEYQDLDKRIKAVYTGEPYHISENTNKAMELATGDYITFLDHDDLLAPNALYECVKALNSHPGTKIIYSDEDKISMDGSVHFQPHFKPDYNKDMLNSVNYFCHLFMVEKNIAERAGGLNPAYDGAQDYDFVLRCTELTAAIHHIPGILYHWRAHLDSTAENPESKMYAFEAGTRAIQAHYNRLGWTNATVSKTECLGWYRTRYTLVREPLVSIIIQNRNGIDNLQKCLHSIKKSCFHNYEIIIVENEWDRRIDHKFYSKLKNKAKIKILLWKGKFNLSAINNFAVAHADGEYLLFLDNAAEFINPDCIQELLGFCMREDVGVVGARIYFKNDTVEHAGLAINPEGIVENVFAHTPKGQYGYFSRIITQQDYSAVSGVCFMVKRAVFEQTGGFDIHLQKNYYDVDLCLRIRNQGYLVVYNPYAELYHYKFRFHEKEIVSNLRVKRKEIRYFLERWNKMFKSGDPYYSINFMFNRVDI